MSTEVKPGAISTRKAAANYIGCERDKLIEYEIDGRIVPKRHGRRLVYLVKDLDALLDSLPEYEQRRKP